MDQFALTSWIPRYSASSSRNARSKVGGLPNLGPSVTWPKCNGCETHMSLLFQLETTALPESAVALPPGLLQVFCCMNPDSGCETFDYNEGASLVRLEDLEAPAAKCPSGGAPVFPEMTIMRWEERGPDYPTQREGVMRPWKCGIKEFKLGKIIERKFSPNGHMKVSGWPAWVSTCARS